MAEKTHNPLSKPLSGETLAPEEQLVIRALGGDEKAFGDLYQRYLTDIYHYIYYRVNCRQEAEDLSEAVFLRAWKALDENPPDEAVFRLWLYRIAHNMVVDHYRTRKDLVGLEAAAGIAAPIDGPEEAVADQEKFAALHQAMQSLNQDQQQVLACRFIAGLSHAETAAIMARSEQAVRALQYRALVGLRNLLVGMASSPGPSQNGSSKNGQSKNSFFGDGLFIKREDSYV